MKGVFLRACRSWAGLFIVFVWIGGSPASDAATIPLSEGPRTEQVVSVSGPPLSALVGMPIAEFHLFRYDAAGASFVPIPFQVDERFLRVFDPGLPSEFTEMVYDVFGEEDGLFDTEDEVVFVFADGGARAPLDGSWVEGADETRYEIKVVDPRTVNPEPPQYIYVYTGAGLPRSPVSYVEWNGAPDGSVMTPAFRIDLSGNWLATGLAILPPCGSGTDLIDRFKGRAEPGGDSRRQDEEDWLESSTYLGGRDGPIRVIRYVRGARSGFKTILRDIVEPSYWARDITLRVHPVDAFWIYFDWLPEPGATLFTLIHPVGLPVDGVPDAGVSTTYTPWHLVRTAGGGLFVAWEVPESPLFTRRDFFYIDNASYNDKVQGKAFYPDDDDSAYGDHGVRVWETLDSNLTPIQIGFRAHPLCGGEGDLSLAMALSEILSLPPVPDVVPQSDCAAVKTMQVLREGSNVRLSWQPDPSADGFHVYASDTPDRDRASWTFAGETVLATFLDPGGATGPDRFYSVVCVADDAEGPW